MMDTPKEMTVALQADGDGMICRECPSAKCGRYFKGSRARVARYK